jgi:hypothetical protein
MIKLTRSSTVWRAAVSAVLFALALAPAGLMAGTTQAWLLLTSNWHESIVSTDPAEKDKLVEGDWRLNGTGNLQTEPGKGLAALHRLTRSGSDGTDRVLETDPARLAADIKAGYHDEGALGFVSTTDQTGLLPVEHFSKDKRHLWLINAADATTAKAQGWKSEGVAFWIWPVASWKK